MAAIAWTDEAQRWLEDIFEYIAADNPQAAASTVQEIYERAQVLARFPEIGHHYIASSRNVRVLLYGHYRIAYLVKDDGLCARNAVLSSLRGYRRLLRVPNGSWHFEQYSEASRFEKMRY